VDVWPFPKFQLKLTPPNGTELFVKVTASGPHPSLTHLVNDVTGVLTVVKVSM
jgi:hypothetical protein